MIMSDQQPRETSILNRGDLLESDEKVVFNTPAFSHLCRPNAQESFRIRPMAGQSENPLTARFKSIACGNISSDRIVENRRRLWCAE